MGLLVGDVDQLAEPPLSAEVRGYGLQVGGRVPGEIVGRVRSGRLQPRLRLVVDEKPPHLLERSDADKVFDVDPAVAERPTVAVGLRDLRLEGNNAFQSRLELAHRSPHSTTTRSPGTLPEPGASTMPLCSAACTRSP